jgi:mannosyltransferase
MFLTVPRGLTKRVIISLVSVVLFAAGYFRFYFSYEHWYLSSGDRLLSSIAFCASCSLNDIPENFTITDRLLNVVVVV